MLRTRVRAGPVAGLVMSVFFALVLTGVQVGDHFVKAWVPKMGEAVHVAVRVPYGPRVIRDRSTGRSELHYEHQRIVVPPGVVLKRESDSDWTAFSYDARHRPPELPRLAAVFAIFFTLTVGLTAYLRRFGHPRLRLLRVQGGLLAAMGLLAVVSKAVLLFTALPEFWLPVAAVPLWVATSFDRRTSFVVTVVLAFVVASFLDFDLVLLCILLARGMSATLLYLDRKRSRQMILAGALAGLSAVALYVAIMVTFEGTFDWRGDLSAPLRSQVIACFGGGLAGGLLGAVLRAPASRLLGHVPRERLLDLSDLEQPLLVQLAREAPGTFEHSRAMANLAEQAASAIGADALLTRVGAYYHDIGKSTQPKYFVENLSPDERSPHDELDPDVSADAIMAHVVLGAKILREGGVPEPVTEFAYTHHGTQLVEYFWMKCQQAGNPKGLDASAFRYPGMRPQTRETAIVMLVDSIEAASRTIDPPEREAFETMIQRIVFTKLKDGQLDESGLGVGDLNVIVNRMADALVNMHHHRIKYQWQAKRAQEFGVPSTAVSDDGTRVAQGSGSRGEHAPEPTPVEPAPASAPMVEVGLASVVPSALASVMPDAPPATARSAASSDRPPPSAAVPSPPLRPESGAHPALPIETKKTKSAS
ncbi:MAG: HDIG domain-containing protein [Myxococcales bacterium]|nr:HDIG domain-containing protein [Myxococcales bacterium]